MIIDEFIIKVTNVRTRLPIMHPFMKFFLSLLSAIIGQITPVAPIILKEA